MRWLAETINSDISELKPPQNINQLLHITYLANPLTCMYLLDSQSVNYVQLHSITPLLLVPLFLLGSLKFVTYQTHHML